jgi:hypothetical protein
MAIPKKRNTSVFSTVTDWEEAQGILVSATVSSVQTMQQ